MRDMVRRWRPLVRAVAISLALGVLATPVGIAHLDARRDVCETPSPRTAGDSDDRVAATTSTGLHDHCFTCHWLQSFRSTLLVARVILETEQGATPLPAYAAIAHERLVRVSVPARAPPA